LADGNRIVRRWTNKLYRNSEGRFRREGSGSPGSALGSFMMLDRGVTILDPVAGSRHLLNDDSRTVRTYTLRTPAVIVNGEGEAVVGKAIAAAKVATELTVKIGGSVTLGPMAVTKNAVQKWESRTEQLGVQNIEGIDAEGTRTVTTIPADAIGNERPIEIVYERWYSKELQLIVSSRHYDPRFGEQTYRLNNIVRSEPDPSLFELPAGYKVVNEGAGLFKIAAPAKIAVQKVAPAKAATVAPAPKPQQ
jgi:hypothetical protein